MKPLVHKRFEIIYADGSVVRGTTAEQYKSAPDADIQFVIVQYEDGSVIKQKALDEYEFEGVRKPGSWTSEENFNLLKKKLAEISTLVGNSNE